MTVSSELNKVIQVGNGVTVDIPFANVVFTDDDLTVSQTILATGIETELVEGDDYTIAIAGDNSSATVTLLLAPTSATSSTVRYSAPNTQLTVYPEGGEFPAESHEDALDKSTLQSLSQQEQLNRSLKMQPSLTGFDIFIPDPIPNAALVTNADATGVEYKLLSETGLTENPMSWENVWTPKTYNQLSVVRDGDWTMIANKETSDRAAPVPVGDVEDNITPEPTFTSPSDISVVWTGLKYTFIKSGWVTRLSVHVPAVAANITYRVFIIDETNPLVPIVTVISDFIPIADTFITIALGLKIIPAGAVFQVILEAINEASSSAVVGDWNFEGTNQTSGPASGAWNRTNQDDVVRISKTDEPGFDRTTELNTIKAGSVIRFTEDGGSAFREYVVTDNPTDGGSFINYQVAVNQFQGTIPDGVKTNMQALVPVPAATQYSEDVGYWPANTPSFATIQGVKEFDGVPQGGVLNNLYGVNLSFQEGSKSADWDLVAVSEGSGAVGSGLVGVAPTIIDNFATWDATDATFIKDSGIPITEVQANTAKVTNATHTDEVTGATALTAQPAIITNRSLVVAAAADELLMSDASDGGNLKRVTAQTIADLAVLSIPNRAPDFILRFETSANVNGGTSTGGSWQTIPLNSEHRDINNDVTLFGGPFILPNNTSWYLQHHAYLGDQQEQMSRIRNVTDGTTISLSHAQANQGAQNAAISPGYDVLADSGVGKTFALEYNVDIGRATDGLGNAMERGEINIFAAVYGWKL